MTRIMKEAAETVREQVGDTMSQIGKMGRKGVMQEYTAKLPSDTFFWLAGGSIVGSLILKSMGKDETSLFVGQWAPTFLLLGVFGKLVKAVGTD